MDRKKVLDAVERTAATFAQAFIALLIADSSGVTQVSAIKVAAVAGGLAAGKYVLVQLNLYLNPPSGK